MSNQSGREQSGQHITYIDAILTNAVPRCYAVTGGHTITADHDDLFDARRTDASIRSDN